MTTNTHKVISVRFYWQHDLDLLPFCYSQDFPMGLWLKAAVRAYARGESLLIPVPPKPSEPIKMDNYTVRFTLNGITDSDVLNVLNQFRKGHCNSAIKSIFRFYMERPNLEPFLDCDSYVVKTRKNEKEDDMNPRNPVSEDEPAEKTGKKIPRASVPSVNKKETSEVPVSKKAAEEKANIKEKQASVAENKAVINPVVNKPVQNSADTDTVKKAVIPDNEPETEIKTEEKKNDSDDLGGFDLFGAIDKLF